MNKKLNLAILLESTRISYSLYEFIEYISKNSLYEKPLLIIKKSRKKQIYKKIISNLLINHFLISIILLIEKHLIADSCPQFLKIYNIKDLKNIKLLLIGNKNKKDLLRSDLKNLKKENIDLFISSSPHLLNDEILGLSKLGSLIFSPFSNFKNQFNLSCLSEVVLNKDTVNVDIFAYKKSSKNLEVLINGKIPPKKTWIITRLFLYNKSIFFLKDFIEKIAINRKLPKCINTRSINYLKENNCQSNMKMLIRYILFILIKKIIIYILNKFKSKTVNCWSIAYSKSNLLENSISDFKEVSNPKRRFLADPFLFSSNGKSYIFVEDYFFDENKGKISIIDISDDHEEFLGVVLEEKFHLSFPFVFNYSDKIYMLPETHEINEIRLYECIKFPMNWKYKCTLMKGVSAADTILIRTDNLWYMLTNICSAGINDHCSELHIFYSDNLFSNKWKPIDSGNPVIFNSLKARNGGIFERDGKIYRINQVQNINEYGYAFDINIIKIIDKKIFLEKEIKRVNPDFLPEISGTHHFNSNNKFSVLDYHRVVSLDKI